MANSDIVPSMKTAVIRAIYKDDDIVSAIDPDRKICETNEDIVWHYLFPYNKNPRTITSVQTFVTVMVHTNSYGRNKTFVIPSLEINIYSHNDHIEMNLRGIRDTRCDFIAKLLDEKFNGSTEYGGIGTLELVSNTEGSYNQDFLYRRLIFETKDVNNSLCESW